MMRKSLHCVAPVFVLLACGHAWAQPVPSDGEVAAPSQTTHAEPAVPSPEAPPPPPPPRPQARDLDAVCAVAPHPGVDVAAAQTAARIVCEEIRRAGVSAHNPGPDPRRARRVYWIRLERLGNAGVLSVTLESPPGPSRTERVPLNSIEEVLVVAPRIAASIVHGQPMNDTARVHNLAGEETREYKKKNGEFFFDIGLTAFSVPGEKLYMGPGFLFGLMYEGRNFAVGSWFNYARVDRDETEASMLGLSMGGRYIFSDSEVSPFAGGGLAYTAMDLSKLRSEPFDYYQIDGSGIGAYAEVGVEFLRLHKVRLNVGLRADLPFYQLDGENYIVPAPVAPGGTYEPPKEEKGYMVPVSLNVALAF